MKTMLMFVLISGSSAVAAQDLTFDIEHTQTCLAAGAMPARNCIGASANACMDASAVGSTTIGMSGCIDRELTFWDGQLNRSYQELRATERREDAEYGSAPGYVLQADALRDMQRAWLVYRDLTCDYERAQWGGGTGGGPATLGCLMQMTAEQTLYLDQMNAEF